MLETSNMRKTGKFTNLWKVNNRHLHNQCLKEEIIRNLNTTREQWWVGKISWRRRIASHSSILGLETCMDREARRAAVHGITKSQTQLSNYHLKLKELEQAKPKANRKEEIMKIRAETK